MSARNTNRSGVKMRSFNAALLGCTTLVALSPVTLWAQDAGTTVQLGTITVDAQAKDDDRASVVARTTTAGSKMATDILDTPASVSVITAKEVQQRGASNIQQVLSYTPGVVAGYYGSDERFDYYRVRGFDAYSYRDGLSLGRPFGGVREEPYAFDRIEVVKGANSSTFGISDPGGSVNFVSKAPRTEKFGEVYATGGSNSHAETGFDFGDNLTSDSTLSYRLTGKIQNADKEYDYSKDNERFLMGGLTWRPSDATSLTIIADYLNRDTTPGSGGQPSGFDLDRSKFFGEPDYNFRGTNRKTLTVMFDHDFGNGLSFGSSARYSKVTSDFGYAYVSSFNPTSSSVTRYFFGNESAAETVNVDARLQYDTTFDTVVSRTLLGVEAWSSNSSQTTYSGLAPSVDAYNPVYTGRPVSVPLYRDQKNDQSGQGVYVQQELTFDDRYILNLGMRHDWMDLSQVNRMRGTKTEGDSSENTYRAALTYKITPDLSVYGSYAESVAPATLTVEPERGNQKEIGVKFRPQGGNTLLSAAIYDLEKTNITVTNPATNMQDTIGKVRVRGVELESRTELSNNLSVIGGYSHMVSKIVDNGTGGNEGNRVQFIPKDEASLWLTYTLAGNGQINDQTFGLGMRYTGSYYFDNANTMKNGGYSTFDVSYSYDLREDTVLQVNVSNLFDKKALAYGGYGADWFNDGRSISATLRHTW